MRSRGDLTRAPDPPPPVVACPPDGPPTHNIKRWIFISILTLSNITLFAKDNYKGGAHIILKEANGSNFSAYADFETTTAQDIIIYFRRTSGQSAVVSNGALRIDPSQMNKYHSSIVYQDFNIQNYEIELSHPFFLVLDPTDKLSVDLNYDTIVNMIAIVLLVIATFVVVTTPLFLLFFHF